MSAISWFNFDQLCPTIDFCILSCYNNFMSVHPDYPGLVREALHSDVYWADYRPEGYEVPGTETAKPFPDENVGLRLLLNKTDKAAIFDTFFSITSGGTVEPIEEGVTLPRPYERQLLYVVEDRRRIVPALSIAAHFDKKRRTARENAIEAAKAEFGDDLKIPGFEEEIDRIDSSAVYLGSGASDRRRVGRNVSLVDRAAYLLKWSEEAGLFVGLQTDDMHVPDAWKSALLEVFPDVPLGNVYSKTHLGTHNELGRIISAKMLEVYTLKPDFSNTLGGNNKTKKREKIPFSARLGQLGLNGIG